MKTKPNLIKGPRNTFANYNENPSYADSQVAMLGVACDISCTYGKGAWLGPQAFLDASFQIEPEVPVFHTDFSEKVKVHNLGIIESPRDVAKAKKKHHAWQEMVRITKEMVKQVETISTKVLKDEKLLMTIGGDHSVTNGVLHALDKTFGAKNVTIVHFDAHLDLREAYDAIEYSHASVMHNARKKGFPMVHIGIRDHISQEEADFIRENKWSKSIFFCATQPHGFYDLYAPKTGVFAPENMIQGGYVTQSQLGDILSQIKTKYVYISFDMDVLSSHLVPGTGTPLPLGMHLDSVQDILFSIMVQSKKQKSVLVGFDITEIAPMLKKSSNKYDASNAITTINEVHASHLAYKMLFWWFVEQFAKK